MKRIFLYLLLATIMGSVKAQTSPKAIVQVGHAHEIKMLKVSNDKKYIMSVGMDNSIKLWDVATGKEIKNLVGHLEALYGAVFMPDQKSILSIAASDSFRIWDIASGKHIKSLSEGRDKYNVQEIYFAMDVLPDGKSFIATAGTPKLFSMETGKVLKTYSGYNGTEQTIVVTKDGKRFVTGTHSASKKGNNTFKIYDIDKEEPIKVLKGHTSIIYCIALSPDGKLAATGSSDQTIIIWDMVKLKKIKEIKSKSFVNAISFTPDSKKVIAGGVYWLSVWDVETGQMVKNFDNYRSTCYSLAFLNDANLFAIQNKFAIEIWDIEIGQVVRKFTGRASYLGGFTMFLDNKTVMTRELVWDLAAGRLIKSDAELYKKHETNSRKIEDGYVLETSNFSGNTFGSYSHKFIGHTGSIYCIAVSPDKKKVASSSADYTLRIWDGKTGKQLVSTDMGFSAKVLAFSPDGSSIAADCFRQIKIWSVAGHKEFEYRGHRDPVSALTFSPDGRFILSGADDGSIKLWKMFQHDEIKTFLGHSAQVYGLAFSPGGKFFVSVAADNTMKYWNLETGKLIFTAVSNKQGTEWIVFNEDGYWDASANGGELIAMVSGYDVWNIDQFAVKNNRPDKILEKNPLADAGVIKHYYNQYTKRLKKLNFTESLVNNENVDVPLTKLVKKEQTTNMASFDISFLSKSSKLTKYNVFVNDVPI
jgi:WD40 repeat protein